MDLPTLISECAPDVSPITMAAILKVESANNPYAIGIVGSHLAIQPASKEQALQVALGLHESDTNFSVGIAQINRYNLTEYNITYEQAFDACTNIHVGAAILTKCYNNALVSTKGKEQLALQSALSCYYSGNFNTGFISSNDGELSYVQKVLRARQDISSFYAVPEIQTRIAKKIVKKYPHSSFQSSSASPVLIEQKKNVSKNSNVVF